MRENYTNLFIVNKNYNCVQKEKITPASYSQIIMATSTSWEPWPQMVLILICVTIKRRLQLEVIVQSRIISISVNGK